MPPNSSNGNTITSTNHINVDLQFVEDTDRAWIDTNKFDEFHNNYEDSQENSSLNTSPEVQFRIRITIKDIDTGVLETKNVFPDTTTVYGGTDGIKLFLQDQVIQSVYRYERSGKGILSIELLGLYINSRSRRRDFSFRRLNIYGTYFNFTGFMLDAIHTNGCCVPQYMFELLSNKLGMNPRTNIAILTMKNVLDDLGVFKEDEGCCIAQVDDFCKKRKVNFYALYYKHKLFETSKDEMPNNNLPRLVFKCANHHMYPVIDEERRETILKNIFNHWRQNKQIQSTADKSNTK